MSIIIIREEKLTAFAKQQEVHVLQRLDVLAVTELNPINIKGYRPSLMVFFIGECMKRNWRIGFVVLIIVSMMVVITILLNKKSNNENFTSSVVSNATIEREETISLVRDSEVTYEIVPLPRLAFQERENPELELLHPIVTNGEHYGTSLGLTFALKEVDTSVAIILADAQGYLVSRAVVEPLGYSELMQDETVYKLAVEGLEPGQIYQYRIETTEAYSDIYTINMPSEEKFSMLVFGDLQGYKQSQYDNFAMLYSEALSYIENVDGLAIAGDIVDIGDNEDQWTYFYNAYKASEINMPLVTAIGNHDVKGSSSQYLASFSYPGNGIEGLNERNFYIDIPDGRIAVIDTERISTYEEQQSWLLEIMSDESLIHKIVLMHRSVYPISYNETHVRVFAETFEAADIDLVLSGHDHIYSRTTVENKELTDIKQGVTYVVCGSGSGSKYYDEKNDSRFWKNIIYDTNNPIVVNLLVKDTISVESFAYEEESLILIDSFKIE